MKPSCAVEAAIRRLLASDEYRALSPREINNGQCEDVQQEVIRTVGLDGRFAELCTENLESSGDLPGHCWIYHDGKHYDAEVPGGVERPLDLPIFVRARSRRR